MKQFLILLSIIITLTISNNTFANFNQNTTFTKNLQINNNNDNDNQNSLFNNQYGYLSTSDWITNQSTTDHKFYSYDTSALTDYTFANARNTFLVDKTGNLVYNTKVIVPDKDKVNIENTKQEMISHKKINTIKNGYNPYSKSEYSSTYFSGNDNWQYIQFGGVGKHIDISQQAGADKVEHSNDLSENLGLYYIDKSACENKISQTIAESLAKYFINQSTLKNKIDENLITKIINLIKNNNDIYIFLKNAPMKLIYKNYSLNYIFDSNNNLVKIYYNEFNKADTENNLNYKWNDSYSWFGSDNSNQYTLLKWIDYAHDWDTFTKIYSSFNFTNNSSLKLILTNDHNSDINFTSIEETNQIKTNQGEGNTNSLYNLSLSYHFGRYHYNAYFNLNISHDDTNIYFKWFLNHNGNTTLVVNLNNVNFFNIMN